MPKDFSSVRRQTWFPLEGGSECDRICYEIVTLRCARQVGRTCRMHGVSDLEQIFRGESTRNPDFRPDQDSVGLTETDGKQN